MYELQVGRLSKIDQQAIGAAMESVTRSGSTRLGTGSAMFRIRVFHFKKFAVDCRPRPDSGPSRWPLYLSAICLYLRPAPTISNC